MKILNSRTKPKTFKKKILSCDLLVMDMLGAALSGGLDDIEKVVKIIKDHHSDLRGEMKEQTLVLVSTVMSWINTPKKVKKEGSKPSSSADDGASGP
jgi:hypothetical protein